MSESVRKLPAGFQFSQSSLQDYADCARRFELRYLDHLKYPAIEAEPLQEHEQRMLLGDAFHRLVFQHQAGIPPERLAGSITDPMLQRWWENYLAHGLEGLPTQRHAELTLQTTLAGYRLLAKYDLLAIAPGERLVIIDWKTASQRPRRETLARRLQTVIYPYVLVEAGARLNGGATVEPEQVSLIYWFAEHPRQPVQFDYSRSQYLAAREQVGAMIREIETRTAFELTADTTRCRFCVYRSLCRRGVEAGRLDDVSLLNEPDEAAEVSATTPPLAFDLDQIAEIEF